MKILLTLIAIISVPILMFLLSFLLVAHNQHSIFYKEWSLSAKLICGYLTGTLTLIVLLIYDIDNAKNRK